jgi:hypothetical protein
MADGIGWKWEFYRAVVCVRMWEGGWLVSGLEEKWMNDRVGFSEEWMVVVSHPTLLLYFGGFGIMTGDFLGLLSWVSRRWPRPLSDNHSSPRIAAGGGSPSPPLPPPTPHLYETSPSCALNRFENPESFMSHHLHHLQLELLVVHLDYYY